MKRYRPEIHHRKSIRLKGYDYSSPGIYFLTICLKNRECLLGKIKNEILTLNRSGKMILSMFYELENKFKNIKCDEFICMPNHIHFIIRIVGERLFPLLNRRGTIHHAPTIEFGKFDNKRVSIPSIVRYFKGKTARILRRDTDTFLIWQRNYYEHIIRNKKELAIYRKYIRNNPKNWKNDEYFE